MSDEDYHMSDYSEFSNLSRLMLENGVGITNINNKRFYVFGEDGNKTFIPVDEVPAPPETTRTLMEGTDYYTSHQYVRQDDGRLHPYGVRHKAHR